VARRSSSGVGKGKDGEQRGSPTPPPPPQPVESKPVQSTVGIRRTERVKRDKPDFYDASGYDTAKPARKVFATFSLKEILLSKYFGNFFVSLF
jgi:hypothetical protein